MQSEYNSILANETWELTELPEGKTTLPCKWVYKKKYTAKSPEPKYKTRLVAKGLKQKKGIDFDEIFSPVVKMTTLRLVLGLVAIEDMELFQMDVKTAFLHRDLDEDVYMKQPEGFEVKPEKPTRADLDALSKQFAMKDLGDAHHFLGMRIKRDRKHGILELSQEEYIHKVLQCFHMQGGKALSTPMAAYVKLSKNGCSKSDAENAKMEKIPYSSAVGSLIYAMVSTRPDIAFAGGVVSRYMANLGKKANPCKKHLQGEWSADIWLIRAKSIGKQ
ncbi:hypothetical protein L7F22_056700 [Adiantum nelumboides]|nr:hypothetical protein [Adiantum nelumboides]